MVWYWYGGGSGYQGSKSAIDFGAVKPHLAASASAPVAPAAAWVSGAARPGHGNERTFWVLGKLYLFHQRAQTKPTSSFCQQLPVVLSGIMVIAIVNIRWCHEFV
jgi:hypothetical protein